MEILLPLFRNNALFLWKHLRFSATRFEIILNHFFISVDVYLKCIVQFVNARQKYSPIEKSSNNIPHFFFSLDQSFFSLLKKKSTNLDFWSVLASLLNFLSKTTIQTPHFLLSPVWFPSLYVWLFVTPEDYSLPDSVHGIFQARILEWIAISLSRGSSCPRDQTHVSCFGKRILYCRDTGEAASIALLSLNCSC